MRQRCPRCLEGRVFRALFAMNTSCPNCGLRFAREPGYFLGAMYVSYAMGIPLIAALALGVATLRPDWPFVGSFLAGWALFLLLVPAVFRFSRVLWMHFDRALDPEESPGGDGGAAPGGG